MTLREDDTEEGLTNTQAHGYEEKEAQYRLKWCDGSLAEYVNKMWVSGENEELIKRLESMETQSLRQ